MVYKPDIHHRRCLRLRGFDYSQAGGYFVTICTQNRECLFGEVVEGEMRLNNAGRIAEQCWRAIPEHFPHVVLDAFVVMPNHLHGVAIIHDDVRARHDVGARHAVPLQAVPQLTVPQRPPYSQEQFGRPATGSLATIVRSYKSAVSKHINEMRKISGNSIWQRNYYEHIIRNEHALARIREYITNNPLQWALDRENPANIVATEN